MRLLRKEERERKLIVDAGRGGVGRKEGEGVPVFLFLSMTFCGHRERGGGGRKEGGEMRCLINSKTGKKKKRGESIRPWNSRRVISVAYGRLANFLSQKKEGNLRP